MDEATELETKLRGAFRVCGNIIANSRAYAGDDPANAVWLGGELKKYRRYMDIIARALTALPDDEAERAAVLRDAYVMFEELVLVEYRRDNRSN